MNCYCITDMDIQVTHNDEYMYIYNLSDWIKQPDFINATLTEDESGRITQLNLNNFMPNKLEVRNDGIYTLTIETCGKEHSYTFLRAVKLEKILSEKISSLLECDTEETKQDLFECFCMLQSIKYKVDNCYDISESLKLLRQKLNETDCGCH